jgi:hypothetical protein
MVPGPEDPERLHDGDEVMQDPIVASQGKLTFFFFIFHVFSFFCCRGQGSRHAKNEGSSDL